MEKCVIVVAGGKGLRMGGDIPKQFRLIGGRPVLMHTLEAFCRYDESIGLVVVLPEAHFSYWRELCRQYAFSLPHTVVAGGATRFHSVFNGLQAVPDEVRLIAVHDGVRPFVSCRLVADAFAPDVSARQFPLHRLSSRCGILRTMALMRPCPVPSIVECRHRRFSTPSFSEMPTGSLTVMILPMMLPLSKRPDTE